MGDMADFLIDQAMMAEALGEDEEVCSSSPLHWPRWLFGERRPIWTDIKGRHYYKWCEITDDHLCNIVRLLERRMKAGIIPEVPQKWYRQVHRRHLSLWNGLTKVTVGGRS